MYLYSGSQSRGTGSFGYAGKGITLLRCPGTIEDGVLAVQQHKKTLDNGFALV